MQARDEGQLPDREAPGAEPNGDSLKHRLAALWASGDMPAFYGTVSAELTPRIEAHLRGKKGLSLEDAQDCVQDAIGAFIRRQTGDRSAIPNPQAYLWKCAINVANDMLTERGEEAKARAGMEYRLRADEKKNNKLSVSDALPEPPGDVIEVREESAVFLAESLFEDMEVNPAWAARVVAIAVSRLRPPLRSVVRHILDFGPDYEATSAPADLGIPPKTYRANKSKAYKDLRRIVPVVMQELGIELVRLGLPDSGLIEARDFPSEERED